MKVSTERCDEEKENQILVVCEEEFFLDSQKDDVRVSHDVIEMSQTMVKKIRISHGKQRQIFNMSCSLSSDRSPYSSQ
jgi:hypothetical protein